MKPFRWREWARLMLGTWLFLAPFLISHGAFSGVAARNSFAAGGAIAIAAGWVLPNHARWEEWANLVLGLWLVGAPFALDFYRMQQTAAWNQIVVGIAIVSAALWSMVEDMMPLRRHIMKNDGTAHS